MPINLQPLAQKDPLWLPEAEYDALVKRTQGGWSACADEKEWQAKLHYLRQGLKSGKLAPQAYQEREWRLVEAWLKRLL